MSDTWMGSLAAQDRYRELGNDPWTNTMRGTRVAPGQGFAAAEPVLYQTASPLVNITEGDIGGAMHAAMGASGGGLTTGGVRRKLVEAPEGGVYEPSQIRANEKYFKAADPTGGPGNIEALVRFHDKNTASIEDILQLERPRETGRGTVGHADIRDLLRQFREMYPEITTLTGKRVSGAKEGGNYSLSSEPRSAQVNLPAGDAPGDILNPSMVKAKAKAEALHGKYPQYAESYPPVGPPALLTKLEGGKAGPEVPYATMEEALARDAEPGYFLSKKLTPEVEQFSKDRNIIQKNLDLHGYNPYFDPAKRFDVDPTHYAPFRDTGVEAAPKTAKTDAEWLAKYGTPENRAKLQAGYEKGKTVPDSENWYFMGQLEKEYIKEYGEKAGREAFKREFGDMMSATTGGAAPYDNFLMAQYANVAAKQGTRLPERAYEMPFPIGGRYASGNIAQAQKYIDEGMVGFDPAVNPKRYDFSGAFTGNPMSMTIDEQMYGALRPSTTKASVGLPEWYGPATRVAREEAAKVGVDPRSFQDIAWAGLKADKTEGAGKLFQYEGPMINHINRSIETTHRLTGMPRDEIVRRGLIRKEIPMYGIPGAVGMGALANQGGYQPEERM